MFNSINELKELTEQQTKWRGRCLNLIASENLASKTVRWYLTSDFGHRYNTFYDDPMERNYLGNKCIALVETKARETAQKLFGCNFVELRPLGGEMACDAVILSLTETGDTVLETGEKFGGQEVCSRLISAGLLKNSLNVEYLAYDLKTSDLDIETNKKLILKTKPKLIIFGKGRPLFPESIDKLRPVIKEVGAYTAYDISHVLGLIAGKAFFNPLDYGADVIMGSTHKTFPGPQGGIILCNDEEIFRKIRLGLYPPLVTNHHANRIAAMAAALIEMLEFGEEYHSQIIKNSQALGKALYDRDFNVLFPELSFSKSHQLHVDVSEFGGGVMVADLLEKANIILGATTSIGDIIKGTKKMSIRMGTQEITRTGMKEKDMNQVAEFFKRLLIDEENTEIVKKDLAEFVSNFNRIHYTWDNNTPTYDIITNFD